MMDPLLSTSPAFHKLQPFLSDCEELLWAGQPPQGVILQRTDLIQVSGSLVGLIIVAVFSFNVFSSGLSPILLPVILPVLLVAATMLSYISVGHLWVARAVRAKIFYGITNRRVIIHNEISGGKTESFDIKTLTNLSLEQGKDGYGSIIVGDVKAPRLFSLRAPFDFGILSYMPPALEMIPNVRAIYELIQDIRS